MVDCPNRNEIVTINKPMQDASKEEFCTECKNTLQRVFSSPGVRTGDGYKS